jgi:hypothetical protein
MMFVHIFFLPYLKENLINYLISLTSAGYPVSGLTRYPAGQSGIRPDTGYQKRPDYPAGYPVHPYSLNNYKDGVGCSCDVNASNVMSEVLLQVVPRRRLQDM